MRKGKGSGERRGRRRLRGGWAGVGDLSSRRMRCRICFEDANEPRVSSCGHTFCEQCLSIWFQNCLKADDGGTPPTCCCPVCRKPLDQTRDVITVYDDRSDPRPGETGSGDKLGGKDLGNLLTEFAKRYERMNRENSVLRHRVATLSAELSLLRGLRPKSSRNREGEKDESKEGDDMKENDDPRAETQKTTSLKELRPVRFMATHSGPVHGVDISKSGFLVSVSWDATAQVTNLKDGGKVCTLEHEHGIYNVSCHPSSDILATASGPTTCFVWDIETRRRLRCFDEHKGEVNFCTFSPDSGNRLATASADFTCMTWDVEHATRRARLVGHSSEVYGCAWVGSHQPSFLVSCGFDRTVRVWDERAAASGEVQCITGHTDDVIGVNVYGNIVASGSDDGTCRLFDIRTKKQIAILYHHQPGQVKRVKFSNNGKFLATTSGDKTVRIYEVASLHCVRSCVGHMDHVFDVAWSDQDEFIASCSHDHTCNIYEPKLGA